MEKEVKISHGNIIKWNAINYISNLGSKFIITVILQRLLEPADFGIIASILVFSGVAQVFIDNGFQSAIIQAKQISPRGLSSVFLINIGVGFLCTLALFLAAPLLGRFYNNSLIVDVTRLMAFTYLVQSFTLVQRALLTRAHAFKTIAMIEIVSNALAGALAIVMAMKGYEVWSIAAMYLGQIAIANIMYWIQSSAWKPSFVFDAAETRQLWRFGSKVFLSGLFIYINSRIDLLMTGRFFLPSQQGFYSRGKDYGLLPSGILIGIVSKSYFPIFSRLQSNNEELKQHYFRALSSMGVIAGFAFPLLFLLTEDAVLLVLKEKWSGMIHVTQLFIVLSSFHIFNSVNANFLAGIGRPKANLKMLVSVGIIRILSVLLYFMIVQKPIMSYVVLILIAFSLIENHISFQLIRKEKGYAMAAQYAASYKSLVIGWLIAGGIFYILQTGLVPKNSYFIGLLVAPSMFVTLYFLSAYFTNNLPALKWSLRPSAKKEK